MESTIQSGKHHAENVNLMGSAFENVNLATAAFHYVNLSGPDYNDVNLSSSKFHNINLSDIQVTAVQIGGATFKHVGPPCKPDGTIPRQRPVKFEYVMLCGSTFDHVDFRDVQITNSDIEGLTVDGIDVSKLIEKHKRWNG